MVACLLVSRATALIEYSMNSPDHQVQDRLNAALSRVSTITRALEAHERPGGGDRTMLDLRRLSQDLERTLVESRDAASGREALRQSAETAGRRASLLFQLSPAPCLVLDRAGAIVDANPAAVRLLNTSQRHLVGRSFPMFVAADRESFLLKLAAFDGGEPVHTPIVIRPRERGRRGFVCAIVADEVDRVLILLLSTASADDTSTAIRSTGLAGS